MSNEQPQWPRRIDRGITPGRVVIELVKQHPFSALMFGGSVIDATSLLVRPLVATSGIGNIADWGIFGFGLTCIFIGALGGWMNIMINTRNR